MTLYPYFEVNGERYDFHRARYLTVELERIRESSKVADDDQRNVTKLQDMYHRLEKLKQCTDELFDEYLKTFSDEAEEKYERANAKYEQLRDEIISVELGANDVLRRMSKAVADSAEKLVIIALQHDDEGKIIRSKDEAEKIWCAYVDEAGQKTAQEWLNAFIEHITGEDEREDDNPFLAQAKARAEQAANRRAGMSKIKK